MCKNIFTPQWFQYTPRAAGEIRRGKRWGEGAIVVVYLTKNSEAQQFCSSQWTGKIVWAKDLCGECPLHEKCSNPPVVPGIAAYTEWMNGINSEAIRISIGAAQE